MLWTHCFDCVTKLSNLYLVKTESSIIWSHFASDFIVSTSVPNNFRFEEMWKKKNKNSFKELYASVKLKILLLQEIMIIVQ